MYRQGPGAYVRKGSRGEAMRTTIAIRDPAGQPVGPSGLAAYHGSGGVSKCCEEWGVLIWLPMPTRSHARTLLDEFHRDREEGA